MGCSVLLQPPNSAGIIVDGAQWGSPVLSFVFDGGVLNAGASFGSEREFRIDKRAVINTHGGAVLHLSGQITSLDGSSQGLAKLGAGTLRLSGANDYRDRKSTRLNSSHLCAPRMPSSARKKKTAHLLSTTTDTHITPSR